jgi:hypothetical protein
MKPLNGGTKSGLAIFYVSAASKLSKYEVKCAEIFSAGIRLTQREYLLQACEHEGKLSS